MKIRLKFDNGWLRETTLEAVIAGMWPKDGRDGPVPIGYDQFYCTSKDGTDIFVGDTVLVNGRKKIGQYETTVVLNRYEEPELATNKTILIDNFARHSVISKIK